MKDKLEVGMYYRYKGIIGKYYKPDLGKPFFTNQHKYTWNEIANGGKFSHNIIDLIEVGDYVNGYKITSIYDDDSKVNEYNLKHQKCLGKNIYDEDYQEYLIYAEDIKSIVTKEQFESMEYKLGGDKNE